MTAPGLREFETGATRDTEAGKPDFRGFMSPLVLRAFGEYMDRHRVQRDGSLRASDNWKLGIPIDAYLSCLLRHVFHAWEIIETGSAVDHLGEPVDLVEALMACMFNVQGIAHETLRTDRPAAGP